MPRRPAPETPETPNSPEPLRWDLFCRVVDNLGDVGVCWRLARELAARGQRVQLYIDDASALDWMAPGGAPGVAVRGFDDLSQGPPGNDEFVGDVVVEAFGCDPPALHLQRMARRASPPLWLNLEYLSAEGWVERCHGLPSPQASGLEKRFFFPGFTPRTGGLLREADLSGRRARFDRFAWLAAQGIALRPGERVMTLFSYANAALPALLQALAMAPRPTRLLVAQGPAQAQVSTWLAAVATPENAGAQAGAAAAPPCGALQVQFMPWLTQTAFDELLWSADLNFVRGEDSLVRAVWAGAPFVWQAYPQHDGVHTLKVQALLERMGLPPAAAVLWRVWNGMAPAAGAGWGALDAAALEGDWAQAARRWRDTLLAQDDLVTQLLRLVAARRAAAPADARHRAVRPPG